MNTDRITQIVFFGVPLLMIAAAVFLLIWAQYTGRIDVSEAQPDTECRCVCECKE